MHRLYHLNAFTSFKNVFILISSMTLPEVYRIGLI